MKHPIVFADLHHEDLYNSLYFLFEKRLGGTLLRPTGMDWFNQGYWRIAELYNNAPDTIGQFLELRGIKEYPFIPPFRDTPLNAIKEETRDYYLIDLPPFDHKAVTVEQFKNADIDYVIASHPLHFDSFAIMINKLKPTAKLICQFGNTWNINDYPYKNVMASLAPQPVPGGTNAVFYHQEFDTNIFCYKPPVYNKKVKAFLHVFDSYPDAPLFYEVEKMMPEWKFEAHGATSRDDNVTGHQNIADAMHDSMFIWHLKRGGDGYGHIIHNAFACGRPPIVKLEYYQGQLAGQLMIDGETCLSTDGLSSGQIVNKILDYSQPEKYEKLSKQAYEIFTRVVDFAKEEIMIKDFLEKIK